jgi:HAE1 family hydrophobic/amphiphilic exporter-1
MKRAGVILVFFLIVRCATGQTFPTPGYMRQLAYPPSIAAQVKGPAELQDHVVEGKLRLTLADAIRLALLNNTDVRLNELPIETARLEVERAYATFDPVATSSFNAGRTTVPAYSLLQGAPTTSTLSQQGIFDYNQTFQTGTNYDLNFSSFKNATNNSYYTLNPYIYSSGTLTLTQPLLRNRGLFPNRAPIVIARRSLNVSRAAFTAQVNDSLLLTIQQYLTVLQARESLVVLKKSVEQAQASYDRDKRALELGAIPPFDIYRSESQVAARRVQVIQAEYSLKQAEDAFRRVIGADLDPYIRALDLDLTEPVEPRGDLLTLDIQQAYQQALDRRPELEALRQQLDNDETNVRLAHNHLLPDLSLSAFYTTNGMGGNEYNIATTPPTLISAGGFVDSLSQMKGLDFPSYGFTVQLRLPIRNRAAQADLGEAMVSRRQDLYRQRQETQALWQEVKNAVHQVEQAELSIAAAKVSRDLAQKTLEAEQRKYELGASQIFFVLDAQTQLAQAELSLVQAEIGYQLAVAGVEHATGTLLENHKVKIEDVAP